MTNTKSSAQLPFGSVGFHITSALPLQTLRGIGMHHITSHDYHWDNRVRKNSYVLLQYTISGKGSFQTPDHTYPQQTGDLFLTRRQPILITRRFGILGCSLSGIFLRVSPSSLPHSSFLWTCLPPGSIQYFT